MSCPHLEQERRRRQYANGSLHLAVQCLTCGAQVRAIKKNELGPWEYELLPEWDETLADRYWAAENEKRKQIYAEGKEEQRAYYHDYLKSPRWKAKRQTRLAIDNAICQAKMDGCHRFATEVHHLTYDHVGNEPMWELISVCRSCHDQISAMDGRKEVAA